jgi:type I restriction enzyme, S subunit
LKSEQSAFPLIRLSALVDINIGKTPARKESSYWKGIHPWVSIRDMKGDRYIQLTKECITDEGIAKSGIKIVSPNTILFSYKLSIGKVAITKIPLFTNEAIAAFPIRDTSKVDLQYLYYVLREFDFTGGGDRAVMGKTLNKAKLKELQIPLPPLAEQQQIAAILDAADSLRQKDRQLIDHYTILSQSLFLEMFGDPVTNPMGWDIKAADSVIDLLTGYAFKSKDYSSNEDDIHLCGGLIITPSGIDWNKAKFWSRSNLDGLERYRIKQDDIVMAMDRPWISSGFKIHKITKSDKESLLVQRTARIRGKNVNQDFLYFLFKHPAFEKQARTTETTVPHISPNDIRNYELIVPPLDLQNQFAERIKLIEVQKQQAQASLEKSEALFSSLLQRAFTGELTEHLAA